MASADPPFVHALHSRHERTFRENRFVYPVLSRRSGGISVGVNLNPDKVCNFDCIYCQVDRTRQSETRFVELDALLAELESTLRLVISGELYGFEEFIEKCAAVKDRLRLKDVKMVLITNASMFHRAHVERGLAILDAHQGEIWAKLDAGTDEYYQLVERTPIPFRQILDNIAAAARARPLVIQALFMRIEGAGPSESEIRAFCERLNEITASGGKLKLVQIYTVARPPAESFVTPLTRAEVDAIVERVRKHTGLETAAFY